MGKKLHGKIYGNGLNIKLISYSMLRKNITVLMALLCGAFTLSAQSFTYGWKRVAMDTTWMGSGTSKVEEIVSNYQPKMEDLMDIVGYSSEELSKRTPESGLSNLAADALIYAAKPLLSSGDKVFSITNYGGIRSELPKGAIRKYDIFSVFPFDNKLVVVELPGYRVREIMETFVKRGRFEALGGVKVVVNKGKLTKCEVGGEKLNDKKFYKLVTIDFLMDGGDNLNFKKDAKGVEYSSIFVRDGVVQYIMDKTDKGIILNNKPDGRIEIIK